MRKSIAVRLNANGLARRKETKNGNAYYVGEDKNGDQFTWVLEEKSFSTKENAELSLNAIVTREWNSVAVSTSHFHQFRSKRCLPKSHRDEEIEQSKGENVEASARIELLEA